MSYILDALRKSDQQRQLGAAPTLQMGQAPAMEQKQAAHLYYGLLAVVLLCAGIAIGWLRPWQVPPSASVVNSVAARPPEASVSQQLPVQTVVAPAPMPEPQAAAPLAQIAPAPASSAVPAPVPVQAPAPVRAAAPAPLAAPARALAPAAAPLPAAPPVVASAPVAGPVPLPAPLPVAATSPARAKTEIPGKSQDVAAVAAKTIPPEPPQAAVAPVQNVIWLAELPLALQQELPPMTVSVHAYSARPADRMVGINNRMLREGEHVVPGLKLEQITPEGMVLGYKGYSFRRGVK